MTDSAPSDLTPRADLDWSSSAFTASSSPAKTVKFVPVKTAKRLRSRLERLKTRKTAKTREKENKNGMPKETASTWATPGFSFSEYTFPGHQDQAFPSILLRQMTTELPSKPTPQVLPPPKDHTVNESLHSLEELCFVAQHGNIIHRSYQKARILRVRCRRIAHDASSHRHLEQYPVDKQIQAQLDRVVKEEMKQEFVRLFEKMQQKHPGKEIGPRITERVKMCAKRNVGRKMQGQYGRELKQKFRKEYAPLPVPSIPFPDPETKEEHVDDLADLLSKVGLDDKLESSTSRSTARVPNAGTFHHAGIDKAKQRIGQSPPWKIDILEAATLFLPPIEAINESFIRASILDPKAPCKLYILSDPYTAATHIARSAAKLPPKHLHTTVQNLARAAVTGSIPQQYVNDIQHVAEAQAATVSSLLSGNSATTQPEGTLTPSQRNVRTIVQRYEKLARMNSTPLATSPSYAIVDPRSRKKMLWEMYAAALDTVLAAKASAKWPSYVTSSDVLVLSVVRKIEREMASFKPGESRWVAEVYGAHVRNAMWVFKDGEWVLGRFVADSAMPRRR
ncbi:hypothetical protein BDW02DRAFT_83850 [Decorospora gaudefroyi]|uniref:Uncharacterized protein n=1 Tax=Decorospora gaudefroyi TaxID=184978 RepID=A0A6A5KW85_9PLEO|nr:hypothetical protein BDW02DRAFT_83850 [Decorospora gaudefroyi]